MKKRKITLLLCIFLIMVVNLINCSTGGKEKDTRYNERYEFIYEIPSMIFHYSHGLLAGSYPDKQETTCIKFEDVCHYLGHVCLCGAGGYRVSQVAYELTKKENIPLEKGEFTLISSRDHTVSDVIAYVFGCSKRINADKSTYFIDKSISTPRREYHYYIGYRPTKVAVHVIYRKSLLIGHEKMDKLWKIELAFDKDPTSVDEKQINLYKDTMKTVVKDVLLDRKEGLITAKIIPYEDFLTRLNSLK